MKACATVNALTAPPPLSLRAYLQAEFARRCSNNSQYSLRSFAMHLGVDHSTLSQLLRGKRPLTERMIRKLGSRLKLREDEISTFVTFESLFSVPHPGRVQEVQQLVNDTLSLISNPHHFSILELVHLDEFEPDSRWIARVLDTSIDEVNVALSRLTRLGLLEMSSREQWIDRSDLSSGGFGDFMKVTLERLAQRARELWSGELKTH